MMAGGEDVIVAARVNAGKCWVVHDNHVTYKP